jgi:Mob1/phocein family
LLCISLICESWHYMLCFLDFCFVAGNQFPSSFEAIVKKIHRLLLHVLGHVYQCHWQHLVGAPAVAGSRLHGYVNTLAYHFLLFNKHFSLIEDKEIEVLDDLFDRLQFYASSSQRQARKTLMYDSSSSTSNEQFATDVSPSADENKENMVTGRCLGTDSMPATSAAVIT